MSIFSYLIAYLTSGEEIESDPLEQEADPDAAFNDEAPTGDEAGQADEEEQAKQPERERVKRDPEDTNRVDDVDEQQEFDEVQDFAEVDETDETSVLSELTEEPQIYRAQFTAQELALPEPDQADDTEQAGFDPGYDALDELDEAGDALDAEPLLALDAGDMIVDDLVSIEPDDMSDPLNAFRWFSGEDVFDEAGNNEWFAP